MYSSKFIVNRKSPFKTSSKGKKYGKNVKTNANVNKRFWKKRRLR